MTEEQQKEQFSIAYIRAVAATARVNIARPEVDEVSIDISFLTQKCGRSGALAQTRRPTQVRHEPERNKRRLSLSPESQKLQ
jgi:hypothetical protein